MKTDHEKLTLDSGSKRAYFLKHHTLEYACITWRTAFFYRRGLFLRNKTLPKKERRAVKKEQKQPVKMSFVFHERRLMMEVHPANSSIYVYRAS